jgi:hypothetical protein
MGNSTISLQAIFDRVKVKGIPTPLDSAAGYNVDAAIAMGNDVIGDIINGERRFNWKWNRKVAPFFLTNSLQQDYPQIGLSDIAWLEDADRIDINNTSLPKPLKGITVRRQLSRNNLAWAPVKEICWDYNDQLSYGTWPGAGVTYHPLIATVVLQNPIASFIDANGNRLILTTFGTTGGTQPQLPAGAAEGTPLTDGSCVWKAVAPKGQGFRVDPLPGAAGPVWQITVYYQVTPPKLIDLASLIDPIPDDSSQYFQKGVEAYCLMGSPNPGDRPRGDTALKLWLKGLEDVCKQGDKENNAYALLPATSPVESVYGQRRNPQDPSEPY